MATTISRRDSLSLTQMRAFSAYSNLRQVEESDDIVETQLDNWLPESDDESYKLEVEIRKDANHPDGLAFRIIGSRTSGIFISYVDNTSQQASLLMEGDLIEGCNGKDLTGFTCDQAASILRFALLHGSVLQLQITRKRCGSLLMEKRRSLARISQEQERQLGATSLAELTRASSSRMCQSTSCPDYRSNNNVLVGLIVQNSKLIRKIKGDEEAQLLMEHQEKSSPEQTLATSECLDKNPNRYHACNHKSCMRRLHMLSNRWLITSLSLLPRKRSLSPHHPNNYSFI